MEGFAITWEKRKLDHINLYLSREIKYGAAGFEDVKLVHCALPELDLKDIDLSENFMGKKLQAPLIINALTGGAEELTPINKALSRAAARTGIAMAVGSQGIALKKENLINTFRIVRENNKDGIILANISASLTWREAKKAIDMIEADGLQIHLNVPQELIMAEGERSFKNHLRNIIEIIENIKVPVIVKEVGFGLSKEVIVKLMAHGVENFDIGGYGGTNFIAIENLRKKEDLATYLEDWGIPTVCSLVEGASLNIPGDLIATGGIKNPLDAVKSISLGAKIAGIAGIFMKAMQNNSNNSLVEFIDIFKKDMKNILLMVGARNLKELAGKPLLITGQTKEWLHTRGIETNKYAQR